MDKKDSVVERILKEVKDDNADMNDYFCRLQEQGLLTELVIKDLINKNICLNYLAHLPLEDKCLVELFNKDNQQCLEAALTLIDIIFKSTVTIDEFIRVFQSCCQEEVCRYLFKKLLTNNEIDELTLEKCFEAIKIIKNKYDECDNLYQEALLYDIFLKLLKTDDVKFIENKFHQQNYIFNIAISQNPNTPAFILEELFTLSGMKYAKVIRKNVLNLKRGIIF